ncbi:hypothetical protein B0H16DRAFT_1476905 [Mycena metata]|uniref:Uncharacterized protein n=1 Tax=Mycena metata TaxID=1033252 RepID=A0AAD7MHA2_9AGAR|nr:hypothetical protein B0H16DRAFT_1476905 [Mycena metata]
MHIRRFFFLLPLHSFLSLILLTIRSSLQRHKEKEWKQISTSVIQIQQTTKTAKIVCRGRPAARRAHPHNIYGKKHVKRALVRIEGSTQNADLNTNLGGLSSEKWNRGGDLQCIGYTPPRGNESVKWPLWSLRLGFTISTSWGWVREENMIELVWRKKTWSTIGALSQHTEDMHAQGLGYKDGLRCVQVYSWGRENLQRGGRILTI